MNGLWRSSAWTGRFTYPLGLWVVFAILAVINGIFREVVLVAVFAEGVAHVLSTAILIMAILLLSWLYFSRTLREYTRRELLLIGLVWTGLVVLFELVALLVAGAGPSELLAPYDVLAGSVWVLVPLTLFIAPLLFGHILSTRRSTTDDEGTQ